MIEFFELLALLGLIALVLGAISTPFLISSIWVADATQQQSKPLVKESTKGLATSALFPTSHKTLPKITVEAFTPRKVDANGMEQIDQAQIDAIKAKIEAQKNIPTYQAEFEILD